MNPNRAALLVAILVLVAGITLECGLRFTFHEAAADTQFVDKYTTKSHYIVKVDKKFHNPRIIQILGRYDGCEADCVTRQTVDPEQSNTFTLALWPNMNGIRFHIQADNPNGNGTRVYLSKHDLEYVKVYDGTANYKREVGLWTMAPYQSLPLFTIQEFTTRQNPVAKN